MHTIRRARASRFLHLRDTRGAIDLASILVGVIVIGVLSSIIAAIVFAVMPWSQDRAAEASLGAVRTAESAARVQDGKFFDYAGLVGLGKIAPSKTVGAATDAEGTCYISASVSVTGAAFWSDNLSPRAREYKASDTSDCADLTALVTSLGWVPQGGTPPEPTALEVCQSTATVTALEATTASALTSAFAAGGPVRLGSDITMTSLATTAAKATTLDLAGHTLTLSSSGTALSVPTTSTFTVVDSGLTGVLNASSGSGNAAIGGRYGSPSAGTMNFECGTINAIGGVGAPGIGSGRSFDFAAINISGGIINATSTPGAESAGIGSAFATSTTGSITISGGVVTARAGKVPAHDIGASGDGYGGLRPTGPIAYTGGVINGVKYPINGDVRLNASTVPEIQQAMKVASEHALIGPMHIDLTADVTSGSILIPVNEAIAFDLQGHAFTLTSSNSAAIIVPKTATLIIQDSKTGGVLDARSTHGGSAGIGGSYRNPASGTITIKSGTVYALSGLSGAGIGGGRAYDFEAVNISGGNVTAISRAMSANGGAGIGSAFNTNTTGKITITGGTVTAVRGSIEAEDIGGGDALYTSTPTGHGAVSILGGLVNGVQY